MSANWEELPRAFKSHYGTVAWLMTKKRKSSKLTDFRVISVGNSTTSSTISGLIDTRDFESSRPNYQNWVILWVYYNGDKESDLGHFFKFLKHSIFIFLSQTSTQKFINFLWKITILTLSTQNQNAQLDIKFE